MRPSRQVDALAAGLIAALALAAIPVWNDLPPRMAIHFSGGGTPDGFASRPVAVFGTAIVGLGAIAVVRASPRFTLEPMPRRVQDATVLFVGGIFGMVQAILLVWNLGFHFDVTLALVPILLLTLAFVAYVMVARGRVG